MLVQECLQDNCVHATGAVLPYRTSYIEAALYDEEVVLAVSPRSPFNELIPKLNQYIKNNTVSIPLPKPVEK